MESDSSPLMAVRGANGVVMDSGPPIAEAVPRSARASYAVDTAHATDLPGVMLATSATADSSGTLTTASKNIRLASGTQITLGVAVR